MLVLQKIMHVHVPCFLTFCALLAVSSIGGSFTNNDANKSTVSYEQPAQQKFTTLISYSESHVCPVHLITADFTSGRLVGLVAVALRS